MSIRNVFWISVIAILAVGAVGLILWSPARQARHLIWAVPGGDPRPGGQAIVQYGCSACHVISGIRTARGRVGPILQDIQQQIYIGGVLPNTPENMVLWIQNPPEFCPATAMPDLDVTEQDARDMAAYLYENS